jgi:hypothetical protein
MSTLYNRRRGGKANGHRMPRKCRHLEPAPYVHNQSKLLVDPPVQCPQLAPRNRYCDDHQVAKPCATTSSS